MNEWEPALTAARAAVSAPADVPGRVWPVRRPGRERYLLVVLGRAGESGWLVALPSDLSQPMTWAVNPSGRSPVADPPERTASVLVWDPAESRSPLYPVWRPEQ